MVKKKYTPLEEWLTTKQVADLLGVTHRYVEILCTRGEIECKRIVGRWLVNPTSVEGWTRKRKPKGSKAIE